MHIFLKILLCSTFFGTAPGQGPSPNYALTAYPPSPVDGESMTLSCTDRNDGIILTAVWFRSGGEIFQTSSDTRTDIITSETSNMAIYRDVEDRISVSTSTQQQTVMLKVKASSDNGTVWRYQSGSVSSNNIPIDITDHKDTMWSRNGTNLLQTRSDTNNTIASTINSEIYHYVEDRIGVSISIKQNNVTLRVNATIDDGTVWRCNTGGRYNNSITIDIGDHNMTELTTPMSRPYTNIYIIVGIVCGGILIIIIIVVISVVWFVKKRRKHHGDATRESDVHVYSTMSRDDNHDNQYTDLNKVNLSERLEKTCYYNTVSDTGGHMYENPPLSQNRHT